MRVASPRSRRAFGRAPADTDRSGTVELGFRLVEQLGCGEQWSTYLGRHDGVGDAVLKIATPGHRRAVQRRFEEEFRAASRVRHPATATAFSVGKTSDGVPAIAMQFVSGTRLDLLLQQRSLPTPLVLDVFVQLSRALSAFHSVGVWHRHLSTRSVMVREDEPGAIACVILDFGALLGEEDVNPEATLASNITGPDADIHALGVMAWQALSGQMPPSAGLDIRQLGPSVPRNVAELVVQMLSSDRDVRPNATEAVQRWISCRALLGSLRRTHERTSPSHGSSSPPRRMIESFIGDAPELIAEISEGLDRDETDLVRRACDQLRNRALALGGTRLARLSNACAAFADDGDLTSARGFMEDLEVEYATLFRHLMTLLAQP